MTEDDNPISFTNGAHMKAKKVRIYFLLMTLAYSLIACDGPKQKEARYLSLGNAFFIKGEYEKARIDYKNAIQIDPVAAEPRYRLGLVEEADGDLKNAFADFSMAEQQDSHFHPAMLKVAQYFMAAEQYDQTRRRIDAVLAEDPKNSEAHALSAALSLRDKNFSAAESEAKLALSEDPANISACAALTGIYAAQKQFDKAIAVLNEGISRHPDNDALLTLRIAIIEQTGDLPKISDAYQALFKLKPDETKYRVALATVYLGAGKIDEAESTLRAGIDARPDDWDMKHQLMVFLDQQLGPDVAEQEIKKLEAAYPANDKPYFWLADLYAAHDEPDKAISLLQEIVSRRQVNESALTARTSLAKLNLRHGNKDLAIQLVDFVLEKQPDNRDALFTRANLAYENGNFQRAITDLRSIISLAPQDQEALKILGEVYLVQGHFDLAIDTMKKAVSNDPSDLAEQVRLAQTLDLNGDGAQARERIAQVIKANPAYPQAWETSARIAIDLKQWLPAEAAIKTLGQLPNQQLTSVFLEGQLAQQTGTTDKAVDKYKEIVRIDPSTPLAENAMIALFNIYRDQKDMAAAARYFAAIPGDGALPLTMLGESNMATNNIEDARAALEKAIAAKPSFQAPYLDLAKIYVNAGQTDHAINILKQGAQASPRDNRAPLMEADLLSRKGKYSEAIAVYDDLLARDPSLDIAANNMAAMIADYMYNDPSLLEKARQAAERFTNSVNPLMIDTLAWVYFRQNNFPVAHTLMSRALSSGTNVPAQMHYHYGAIMLKEGKIAEAQEELRRALSESASYPGAEDAKNLLAGR